MQVFGDEKLTTALLDRLGHHSHILTTRGASYRTRRQTPGLNGGARNTIREIHRLEWIRFQAMTRITMRAMLTELALDPALERIASGLGPSGGPPRPQAHPATTNGTMVNAAAPTVLRSPTARQAARWKAIQQALLQGLSMRATARLLGISRNTIRRYVRAGGPPGRQGAASSTSSDHPGGHFR